MKMVEFIVLIKRLAIFNEMGGSSFKMMINSSNSAVTTLAHRKVFY